MTTIASALEQIVARYPFLGSLPDALRERLSQEMTVKRIPAGTRLFDEQDACQAFPLVLSGTIRVAKVAPSGRRLKLYDVEPGDSCILTSSCLIAHKTYPARGATETDVELAVVPAGLFMTLIDQHEPVRRHVFALFAERLTELMALVEAVAFQRLDQRLAARLLGHGTVLRLTHQQLADELGSAREIVSRVLGQFADEGLIRSGRQEIEILDANALRQRATGQAVVS
jgi:CRP/FNR family transcriptional regulator, anaerobic regulatory protein